MKLTSRNYLTALALFASCLPLRAQVQITLPAPIVRETFDSVEEGKLPAGWSVTNFTDSLNGVEDLSDPKSDSCDGFDHQLDRCRGFGICGFRCGALVGGVERREPV